MQNHLPWRIAELNCLIICDQGKRYNATNLGFAENEVGIEHTPRPRKLLRSMTVTGKGSSNDLEYTIIYLTGTVASATQDQNQPSMGR
jgi:hypothetical protein